MDTTGSSIQPIWDIPKKIMQIRTSSISTISYHMFEMISNHYLQFYMVFNLYSSLASTASLNEKNLGVPCHHRWFATEPHRCICFEYEGLREVRKLYHWWGGDGCLEFLSRPFACFLPFEVQILASQPCERRCQHCKVRNAHLVEFEEANMCPYPWFVLGIQELDNVLCVVRGHFDPFIRIHMSKIQDLLLAKWLLLSQTSLVVGKHCPVVTKAHQKWCYCWANHISIPLRTVLYYINHDCHRRPLKSSRGSRHGHQ